MAPVPSAWSLPCECRVPAVVRAYTPETVIMDSHAGYLRNKITLVAAALVLAVGGCGGDSSSPPPALDSGAQQDAVSNGDAARPGMDASLDATLDATAGGNTDGGNTDSGSDAVVGALSDAQIADILAAADMGEIMTATTVQPRLSTAGIVAFARMMVSDHTMSSQNLMMLTTRLGIVPVPSTLSTMLRDNAATMNAQLATMSGVALDRAYISGQVQVHQQVLSIIDTALLPNVMNADLRTAIMGMVRPMVMMHLQMATSLQSSLGGM